MWFEDVLKLKMSPELFARCCIPNVLDLIRGLVFCLLESSMSRLATSTISIFLASLCIEIGFDIIYGPKSLWAEIDIGRN